MKVTWETDGITSKSKVILKDDSKICSECEGYDGHFNNCSILNMDIEKTQIIKNRISYEYLAGLFDGEGSITINRGIRKHYNNFLSYDLVVRITNKDSTVLQIIAEKNDGTLQSKLGNVFDCSFKSKKAMNFLMKISPFLILKREQAEIAIKFQIQKSARRDRTGKRERTEEESRFYMDCREKIILLNKRNIKLAKFSECSKLKEIMEKEKIDEQIRLLKEGIQERINEAFKKDLSHTERLSQH